MKTKIQHIAKAISAAFIGLLFLLIVVTNTKAADQWMSVASGDKSVAPPEQTLALTVLITDSSGPITGVVVSYTIVQTPTGATGYAVSSATGTTDINGRVTTTLTLGDVQGQYLVQAEASALNNPITFTTGAFYDQAWQEYANNPVFGQGNGGPKAYYPTVIYDTDEFSGHGDAAWYKMWASDGSYIRVTTSTNGIDWSTSVTSTGLTNPHHAQVVYDAGGFGGTADHYKMWYWDMDNLYNINAIRTASSTDGINWSNDQAITQSVTSPLVSNTPPDWNRGSYGPVNVRYQSGAMPNSGTNPFDYSYVMYFDATAGAQEVVGLAYSADGYFWTRYGDEPVLDISDGEWDGSHLGYGTIIDTGDLYVWWYSGGTGRVDQGIGYAVSTDGINWDKRPDGPLAGIGELGGAGSWNEGRNYTPMVLYDAGGFGGHGDSSRWKMWRTGKSDSGEYSIGYAGWDAVPPSIYLSTPHPLLEGDSGSTPLIFTVTLSIASDKPVTVTYATTDETAVSGIDYTAVSETLTFNPGEMVKNIEVLVLGDTLYEPDETFTMTLSNPVNATLSNSQTIGTIQNDDPAATGELQFAQADYAVAENAGAATITVVRTGGSSGATSVDYATSNGTADGNDYTPISGTLDFADGEISKTFTISITNDMVTEPDETVDLTLSNVTNGAALGVLETAVLTITSPIYQLYLPIIVTDGKYQLYLPIIIK